MCEHGKMPDGTTVIICGDRTRRQYCQCGRLADLLCDWKVKERKSGTCDKPICRRCALEVGPDKHLCREHALAYAAWQKKRDSVGLPPEPPLAEQAKLDL